MEPSSGTRLPGLPSELCPSLTVLSSCLISVISYSLSQSPRLPNGDRNFTYYKGHHEDLTRGLRRRLWNSCLVPSKGVVNINLCHYLCLFLQVQGDHSLPRTVLVQAPSGVIITNSPFNSQCETINYMVNLCKQILGLCCSGYGSNCLRTLGQVA